MRWIWIYTENNFQTIKTAQQLKQLPATVTTVTWEHSDTDYMTK